MFYGLSLKAILILIAVVLFVLSGIKKLFKLAFIIAVIAFLYYLFA